MKVCTDFRPSNKKVTVLQFKRVNFVQFHQNSSEIDIFATVVVFHHFVSFFCKNTKSFGALHFTESCTEK